MPKKSKPRIYIKPSKRGSLRKATGTKKGKKIPAKKLAIKKTDSPAMRKKKQFAINAKKMEKEMMEALLKRIRQNDKQTQGILIVYDNDGNLQCALNTIELPWRENKKEISCIPRGTYKVMARNSEKYGEHYIVESVPNRSLILIHPGNYYDDTRGCILPGLGFGDIDSDDYLDVTSSRDAMQKLWNAIGKNPFLLTIQGVRHT